MSHYAFEAICWLLLAALVWAFWWPYRRYQVDKTRYRLFVIRDALFDAAAGSAEISFRDPAYVMTRNYLNGTLRTLEDHNFVRLICLMLRVLSDAHIRGQIARHQREYAAAVRVLSPEGQDLVKQAMRAARSAFHDYARRTSPATLLLGLVLRGLLALEIHRCIRATYRTVVDVFDFESTIALRDNEQLARAVAVRPVKS